MKWPEAPFSEVAEIVTGNTPPKKDPDNYGPGVPWVKPPDLDGWEPITATAEYLSPKGQKLARLLPEGTVLVCCIGSIGRVGIAGTTLATNQQINSLIFGPRVEPRFGYYYCRLIPQQLQAAARNAVVPILNKCNFGKIKMPLPPVSEQRRIMEILDQADALRKKRAEADAKAARILPALFYKMFGDPATNPKGWERARLGEIASLVTSGLTPRGGATNYVPVGPYFLRSQNIRMNRLDLSDIACLPPEIHEEMSRTKVKFGDVLLNITGASIGRVAWYDIPNHEANVNQHVCIIRLKGMACPEYVSFLLSTPFGQMLIDRSQTGATRQGLNHENVRQIPILLPPRDLQGRFGSAARANGQLAVKQERVGAAIQRLFRNLLHRAFTGDLTAKWREAHLKELLTEMEAQARMLENER